MAIALPAPLPISLPADPSAGAVGRLAQAASAALVGPAATAGTAGASGVAQEVLLRRGLPPVAQVERFQAALGNDDLAGPQDLAPADAGAPDSAGGEGAGHRPGSAYTVGDSILRGLGALSRDLTRVWNDVRGLGGAPNPLRTTEAVPGRGGEVASAPPIGEAKANPDANADANLKPSTPGGQGQFQAAGPSHVGDLLAMQRSMVEFSFLFDAVGKGTSKAIEGTNQLVKMQ